MKRLLRLVLLGLVFAVAVDTPKVFAQLQPVQFEPGPRFRRVPYIGGIWDNPFGNTDQPCMIRQRQGSDRAQFINEHGSRAWGRIRGNHVIIEGWGDDGDDLFGTIRGDRIIWPNGTYWER